MYYTFACPNCGKSLKTREDSAGRKARCPYCRTSVTVPASPAAETPEETGSSVLDFARPGVGPRAKSRAQTEQHSGMADSIDSTGVPMLWTAVGGFLLTLIFYMLLFPLPDIYLRQLFYERGWVTPTEAFLLFWSVTILGFKGRKLLQQRESMLLDVLPESLSRDISVDKIEKFVEHVHQLPVDTGFSFLTQRVLRGLEHFRVRRSTAEVATVLSSQSEIDAHSVSSSYALLNVFIWAIPILGFIGTVQGLGSAVGSLGVADATDVEGIRESLGTITGGLGIAFDTTLVALIMSLLLKFPASSLQKSEEDLLNWVDEYCNENLLKRLKEDRDAAPRDEFSRRLQQAIDAAMVSHHAELRSWSTKLSEIGGKLTAEVLKGWGVIQEDLQQQHGHRLEQVNQAVERFCGVLQQLSENARQLGELQQAQREQAAASAAALDAAVQRVEERAGQRLQGLDAEVQQAFQKTQQLLAELTDGTAAAQRAVSEATQASTESATRWIGGLQDGLQGLNRVLGQLGEKQVVIRGESVPQKRWSLFGRRNHNSPS